MPKSKFLKQQEAIERKERKTEYWIKVLNEAGKRFRDDPQSYRFAVDVVDSYDRLIKHLIEIGKPNPDAHGMANAALDSRRDGSWLSYSITFNAAQDLIDAEKARKEETEWLGDPA